jgi:membrane protein involved in colicin uptake
MTKIVTNLTGADLAFYSKGEAVVIRDKASVDVSDEDAAMLEKHPAFSGLIENGSATIAGKAGRPSKADDAKAKAEAEARAKSEAEAAEKARIEAEEKAKAEAEAAAAAGK